MQVLAITLKDAFRKAFNAAQVDWVDSARNRNFNAISGVMEGDPDNKAVLVLFDDALIPELTEVCKDVQPLRIVDIVNAELVPAPAHFSMYDVYQTTPSPVVTNETAPAEPLVAKLNPPFTGYTLGLVSQKQAVWDLFWVEVGPGTDRQ